MKFGVQFFPNFQPKDKSAAEYFAQSLAIAEEAETLGYSHARSVEHYFERYGGYSPNPIAFLSAVAARTKTMRLVTGAVVPAFNNPLKLAGEIAMLDAISGGRFDVGFARAFLPHEFRRFRHFARRVRRPFPRRAGAGRTVADAGERQPSRAVSCLRQRHLAAAPDAKAAAEILHRLDTDRGLVRIRRPAGPRD